MAFDIREEDEEHHDEFEEYDVQETKPPPKFYHRRKFWYFCIPNAIITLIVAVMLGLYVIMPKIAQGLMNKATIEFDAINIVNPTATSMDITMQGNMRNTGPFSAEISFPGTVYVSWNGIELGTTDIPGTSKASGGKGSLNLGSTFTVTNATAFAEFSSYMLNAQSFVWHLQGKLNVKALSHTVKNLDLSKDITVNAFDGLNGIKIEKFALPGDDPSGKGIIIEIDTTVNNPSAIQMYMGSLTLAISYQDVLMGYVTSSNLTMVRGVQTMSMKGLLIPQNTTEGLAVTSEMMSRYVGNVLTNTTATGVDVKPDGVNSLDWLSAAVKNLKLTVPLQSPVPLQLIKGLNLGALGLVFTPPTAYEPVTTSTGVLANYSLPDGFGFNIQFQQVSNSFALTRGGVVIANLNSTYNPSTSNMAAGTLTFNLLATPLLVPDASHAAFQEFNRDLTVGADLPFQVTGQASVFANTSIGVVNLVNIPFNASTQLSGLQSLANPAPTITSLQVVSGTTTGLTMNISVIIVNPSSISLSAGDVVLALMYKGVNLGTVTMPNLSIVPGANTVATTSTIDPAKSPEGLELLSLYTSGAGASVSIAGTPTSTTVDSLSLAFGALNIETQMPGLQSKLLAGASLEVLNTTLVNGLAQTVVTVNNPFVPAMSILSIDSKITYNGALVGSVVSTFATPPVIPGVGQGTITASLAMNTNPADLVTLIMAQAKKNGMNTDAFEGLLSLQHGGTPPASLFAGFNVADFTIKAMAGLEVDITMTTTVKVGDYQVTIPYTQTGVATATDSSILKLIPLVGTPIAQSIVDASLLAFSAITINSPQETNFLTDIVGAITKTGPLDAEIVFPSPVVVSYNGKAIGSMTMPTVNAVADQGANLDLKGVQFTITDAAAYTEFTTFALNNAKFDWTISTTGIVVNAMGASMPGVSMTKTVTLDGFNKLAGLQLLDYIIESYDDAGLHLSIGAYVQNPSTIGMTIPVSNFQTLFQGTVLGPAVATNMQLIAHSPSNFALNATIAAGSNPAALVPVLEGIFHNAVSNISTPLQAKGLGAPGLSWLDAAIQTLSLDTSLPPLPYSPIVSVNIDAMEMDFTCGECVWKPNATSTITAQTKLPFRNGAPITQLSQNVQILDTAGNLVGTLDTDYAHSTSVGDMVTVVTPPAPLVISDASQKTYENFIGALTAAGNYTLGLRGTASSMLSLPPFGDIEVKGIPLDVTTQLAGLQGLKKIDFKSILGMNSWGDISVESQVVIYNPSQLTLKIGNLTMMAGVNYLPSGLCGQSTIKDLTLVPGPNDIVAVLDLQASIYGQKANDIAADINNASIASTTVYLYGFNGSSPNPALAAGLLNLETSTTIYNGSAMSTLPPYDPVWNITMLPNTGVDGIFELSAMFHHPYPGIRVSIDSMYADPNVDPIAQQDFYLGTNDGRQVGLASWGNDPSFVPVVFEPNDTVKPITWKVQLALDPFNFFNYPDDFWASYVEACIAAPCTSFIVVMPVITLGQDPTPQNVDWSCSGYYPNTTQPAGDACTTTARAPADFGVIRQYFDKLRGPPPTPSPALSPSTVPATPSSPATVAPLPTTTTTVNPIPITATSAAPATTPSTSATVAP
ncbi:hypothetical protein EMPS_09770 [Entomortierella parvispora]|uniref:Uncharacterized protein n=1 Tax=Entomortierella parvispora TaxID=205924 RepID=A0A9P3M0C6_9FUNG|nr:hypothetical protein EMPS_09770 [Entomortierella parvispora]